MNTQYSTCKSCGSIIESYKKSLEKQNVLILRDEECMQVVEQAEFDENNSTWLKTLDNLTNIANDSDKSIINNIKEQIRRLSIPITDIVPKYQIVKKFSLQSFIQACAAQKNISTGILPFGSIYYEKIHSNHIFIISHTPQIIPFIFTVDKKPKTYSLSVPFLHFGLVITEGDSLKLDTNKVFVFLTRKPIRALNDAIFKFPAHNQHGHGNMCVGNIFNDIKGINITDYANQIVTSIFATAWNNDLSSHTIFPPEIKSLENWHNESKKNSCFGLGDIQWQPHHHQNLNNLINHLKK